MLVDVLGPSQLERHFVPQGDGVTVKDSIRRLVSFRPGNLLDPVSYEGLGPLDALFCRNVLIYFSDEAIQRAVQLFQESLAAGRPPDVAISGRGR